MEQTKKRRRKRSKKSKRLNDVAKLLFFLYAGFMIWLLFVLGMENTNGEILEGGYKLNLIPFKTIKVYFDLAQSTTDAYMLRQLFVSLISNVILFIPLGFFLPWVWKKLRPAFKAVGASIAIIVAVEITQLITFVGSCDIDDLLLNSIGALIGYLIWRKVQKIFNL